MSLDNKAMFKIGYGLYVLTANENGFDNGCIVNTVIQVTSDPVKVLVAVNKMNKTCEMIKDTKKFNVSVISQKADFELFKHFGFASGRDTDKFEDYDKVVRSENGLLYVTEATNSFISCDVDEIIDAGSHLVFMGTVTESKVLTDDETATYTYYHENIKPKPEKTEKKGYRCTICGYIYEGDTLPDDYVCPLCKHGAADFEPI